MEHCCHWPTGTANVPPALWGCSRHWYMLPRVLRARIWANYRKGQEIDKKPSAAYIQAAIDVQEWCCNYIQEKGDVACIVKK